MNATTLPDYSRELRHTYLGAVPHTVFTALVWLLGGTLGQYGSKSLAILTFIITASFIFVGGELIRKAMKARNVMSVENKLPQLFTLLAFTIPLSYPIIYLVCRDNVNLFFPSFMILIGAHYLPFVYGYKMITFGVLAFLLVGLGTFFSIFYPAEFALPAFVTGIVLLVFAVIHYRLIKKEIL